jgi:glyoxylase-like metal-dependent hydrolase (beta-lactamase superfamily II)
MTSRWVEVGANVFMRRYRTWRTFKFDQNVGLILGERGAVVVDTRASHRLAARVLSELRGVTRQPLVAVVNTHHHWDHTWGNALFKPAPIWGHVNCARYLVERNEQQRQRLIEHEPGMADEFAEVQLTPPDRTLVRSATIDLGDRRVRLRHLGRGHTDNDVVVEVPDAHVLFAGDLMVDDTMPGFGDAYPIAWAGVLRRLAAEMRTGAVVPGHGGALTPAGIRERRDQMREMVTLGRAVARGRIAERAALQQAPFTRGPTLTAIERIRAELASVDGGGSARR